MKPLSIVSLAAAFTLSVSPLAFAQANVTGNAGVETTVNGTVGGANTSGSVGAGAGVGVNVDSSGVDLSLDTNADGTVDAGEQAAAPSTGSQSSGNTSGGGNGTTPGSTTGTTTPNPAAGGAPPAANDGGTANDDLTSSIECTSVDLDAMVDAGNLEMIASATSAQIVRLTDCDEEMATVDSKVESAVFGNQTIAAMLAAEGVGGGEIRGVTVVNGSVTVFVDGDDSVASGDADEGATAN